MFWETTGQNHAGFGAGGAPSLDAVVAQGLRALLGVPSATPAALRRRVQRMWTGKSLHARSQPVTRACQHVRSGVSRIPEGTAPSHLVGVCAFWPPACWRAAWQPAVPLVGASGARLLHAEQAYRASLAWHMPSAAPELLGAGPGLGLRAWGVRYVLLPDGPSRAVCAQCGLMSTSAVGVDGQHCDVRSAGCRRELILLLLWLHRCGCFLFLFFLGLYFFLFVVSFSGQSVCRVHGAA